MAAPPRPSAATVIVASPVEPGYGRWDGPCYGHALVFVLLLVLTALLYQADLGLGFFHLDDPTYILNNPWIKSITAETLRSILTTPYFANYSPLHLLSYTMDHALAGNSARAFHLSSNLWAGWVAGWVYLVGLILFGRSPGAVSAPSPAPTQVTRFWRAFNLRDGRPELFALLAALLFVAHPAHVEAVAWISSRKDLVAAAFALPAMAAYFLHRRQPGRPWFYLASLFLFALGVAGKLSVVVVPGILVVFDMLVERRWSWSMLLDKIPYALVAAWFAWRTMGAQPPTRQELDLYVIGHSMLQNWWLLTGLGTHVLARPRPDAGASGGFRFLCIVLPLAIAVVPGLLRRRLPGLPLSLFYWVLLALVPSQVLSFIHPVADRYLFFPSVAAVLLLCWLGRDSSLRRPGRTQPLAPVLLALVAVIWAGRTLVYLGQWQDPRSVWFAATARSEDPLVFQYLGTHYQDQADRLPALLSTNEAVRAQAVALGNALWKTDPRLEALLAEWNNPTNRVGPQTRAYQLFLRQAAREQYEQALRRSGTLLQPNLHFRLGKLALDNMELDRARTEFKRALEDARRYSFASVREELAVRGQHALALVEWQAGNYPEALRWIRLAEGAQTRSSTIYVPTLQQERQRLEAITASAAGRAEAQP